jgi:hypothetical protein
MQIKLSKVNSAPQPLPPGGWVLVIVFEKCIKIIACWKKFAKNCTLFVQYFQFQIKLFHASLEFQVKT